MNSSSHIPADHPAVVAAREALLATRRASGTQARRLREALMALLDTVEPPSLTERSTAATAVAQRMDALDLTRDKAHQLIGGMEYSCPQAFHRALDIVEVRRTREAARS